MFVDLLVKKAEHTLTVNSLKFAVCGGAPLSPQLAIDMINTLGIHRIKVRNTRLSKHRTTQKFLCSKKKILRMPTV